MLHSASLSTPQSYASSQHMTISFKSHLMLSIQFLHSIQCMTLVKDLISGTCCRNWFAAWSRPAAINTSVYCWAHHMWTLCSICRVIPPGLPCVNSDSTVSKNSFQYQHQWLSLIQQNHCPFTITTINKLINFSTYLILSSSKSHAGTVVPESSSVRVLSATT